MKGLSQLKGFEICNATEAQNYIFNSLYLSDFPFQLRDTANRREAVPNKPQTTGHPNP